MLFLPLVRLLVLVRTALRELLPRDLRQARSESFPDFLHDDLLRGLLMNIPIRT